MVSKLKQVFPWQVCLNVVVIRQGRCARHRDNGDQPEHRQILYLWLGPDGQAVRGGFDEGTISMMPTINIAYSVKYTADANIKNCIM